MFQKKKNNLLNAYAVSWSNTQHLEASVCGNDDRGNKCV